MTGHILAIDLGTTSTRCMVFGAAMEVVSRAQTEFPQHYKQPGWVEHDPEDLWRTTLSTAGEAFGTGAFVLLHTGTEPILSS
ncbi:MAG: FGGY family carbohydrate kinase [Janthinobacterium lividum]